MGNENKNTHVDALGSEIAKLRWYGPYGRCPVVVFEKSPDPDCKGYVERTISSPDQKPLSEPPELPYPLKRLTFSGIDFAEKQTCLLRDTIETRIKDEEKRCFVGYDVEFVQPDRKDHLKATLLSHQFYFASNGKRKSFIVLTDERFEEKNFLEIIARAVPEGVSSVYLAAHFSLAEAGWLLESFNSPKTYLRNLKFLDDCNENPFQCYYAIAEYALVKLLIIAIFSKNGRNSKISFRDEDNFFSPVFEPSNLDFSWLKEKNIKDILDCKDDYEALNKVLSGKIELIKVREYTKSFFKILCAPTLPLIPKRDKMWHGVKRLTSVDEIDKYRLDTINTLHVKLLTVFDNNPALQKYSFAPLSAKGKFTIAGVKSAYFHLIYLLHKEQLKPHLSVSFSSLQHPLLDLNAKGSKTSRQGQGKDSPLLLITKSLHFVDTMGLHAASLSDLGEMIGIEKIKLGQGVISKMDELLASDPYQFCHYAIRDSVVCAEAVAWFARLFRMELDLPIKTRITAYSSTHFQKVLKQTVYADLIAEAKARSKFRAKVQYELFKHWYTDNPKAEVDPGENLKLYLGWTKKDKNWVPSMRMQQFARFYNGGWNAAFKIGSRGPCTYHDLKSAYPCAFMMLEHDYDFSKHQILRGSEAANCALSMIEDGPFQIAGVEIMFEFHDHAEPIFPVRVHKSEVSPLQTFEGQDMILYSQTGFANVMFPEFYTAIRLNLLKSYTVTVLETFQTLPGPSKFAAEMYSILERRGRAGMKAIYKSVANYCYGKFAESIRKKTIKTATGIGEQRKRPGALTCFPLAAYATSFCRAAMAELLNKNECLAITTDGFVSPVEKAKDLEIGDICRLTQVKLGTLTDQSTKRPYRFIEEAYVAKSSLIIKTRGYILDGVDDKGKTFVKLSKMGVQSNVEIDENDTIDKNVIEFIDILKASKFSKYSFQRFDKLKFDSQTQKRQNLLPLKKPSEASVSHTFDMKRIPIGEVVPSTFSYAGTDFVHPMFDTKPLYSTSDFVLVRKLSKRNSKVEDYEKLIRNVERTDSNLYDELQEDYLATDVSEDEPSEIQQVFDAANAPGSDDGSDPGPSLEEIRAMRRKARIRL